MIDEFLRDHFDEFRLRGRQAATQALASISQFHSDSEPQSDRRRGASGKPVHGTKAVDGSFAYDNLIVFLRKLTEGGDSADWFVADRYYDDELSNPTRRAGGRNRRLRRASACSAEAPVTAWLIASAGKTIDFSIAATQA